MPAVNILDLVISRGINGLVLIGLVTTSLNNQELLRGRLVAQHMGEFGNALLDYGRQNGALLASQTASGPIAVTAATLQSAGVLSSFYQPINVAGQTPVGIVMQPTANETGGISMNDSRAADAARHAGGTFGSYQAAAPTALIGSGGSWSIPISMFAPLGIAPTKGSVAFRSTLGVNTVVSDFLSRIDTGNPESAKLHQSINVNGNNLNNIGDGSIQSLGRNLSQAVYDIATVASGSTVPIQTCPTGENPQIEVGVASTSDGGAGDALTSFVPSWVKSSATLWTVHLTAQTPTGTVTDPANTSVLVIRKCT